MRGQESASERERLLKALLTVMAILALTLGFHAPAQAQDTVTKTFRLTLLGTVPEGNQDSFIADVTRVVSPDGEEGEGGFGRELCINGGLMDTGPEGSCRGDGSVYTATVTLPAGTTIEGAFRRSGPGEDNFEFFGDFGETLVEDLVNCATYNYDTGEGMAVPCEDGGDVQDDQQSGGDEQTGTGDTQDDKQGTDTGQDDQQGGAKPTVLDNQQTGAGRTPDNQQGSGGEMVTKTFELTLNGEVPADQAFYVGFKPAGQEGPPFIRVFCGQLGSLGQEEDCEGDGTTYEVEYEFEPGTVLEFAFFRMSESGDSESGDVDNERFHEGSETLNADKTNTALYTFGTGAGDDQQDDGKDTGAGDDQQVVPDNQQTGGGKDAGAGDDQQDDTQDDTQDEGTGAGDDQQAGEDKDTGTGAGDDQQTPENQQDDTQDDQQGQMPEKLPDTGAGGLAPGATIPVGNATTGLMMLGGACYAVLRRR